MEVEIEETYGSLSLEETKVKAEYDKQMRLANEHKSRLRSRLRELEEDLTVVLTENCNLPRSQRIPLQHFIVDMRIMNALEESLKKRVDLEKRKVAHELEKSTLRELIVHNCSLTQAFWLPFSVGTFGKFGGERIFEIDS